jgi:hypothetical protein
MHTFFGGIEFIDIGKAHWPLPFGVIRAAQRHFLETKAIHPKAR